MDPLLDYELPENYEGNEDYKAMTLAKIASTNYLLKEKS